jgi:hypothetical protein
MYTDTSKFNERRKNCLMVCTFNPRWTIVISVTVWYLDIRIHEIVQSPRDGKKG